MLTKALIAIVAFVLALAFYAVPIIKLGKPALVVVVLLGVIPMAIDLVEKLRSRDD